MERLERPDNLRFYARRGYRIVGKESHPGYTAFAFAWLRKDRITDRTIATPGGQAANE